MTFKINRNLDEVYGYHISTYPRNLVTADFKDIANSRHESNISVFKWHLRNIATIALIDKSKIAIN